MAKKIETDGAAQSAEDEAMAALVAAKMAAGLPKKIAIEAARNQIEHDKALAAAEEAAAAKAKK